MSRGRGRGGYSAHNALMFVLCFTTGIDAAVQLAAGNRTVFVIDLVAVAIVSVLELAMLAWLRSRPDA